MIIKNRFLKKLEIMTTEEIITPENDPRDYVGYDLFGFPFNKRYPPDKKTYGEVFYGYPTKGEGVLLYDYCIMGYDVEFSYNGKRYFLLNTGEGILSDSHFTERRQVFDSPMALVENFQIDGKTLLELTPEIEDIEPV